MQEQIAVLIPIYNGHEFLNESLDSVVNQTYKNWVLHIAINGHEKGSDVYKHAQTLRETYIEEIRDKIVIHDLGITGGKSKTLNQIVQLLPESIHWVALLDVDDIWHPEKLNVQSPQINTYPSIWSVIGTRCIYIGDLQGIVPEIPTGDLQHFPFLRQNPIINSSAVIRKELCFWDGNDGVEDYSLWLKLKTEGHRFFNCSQILVKHRIHQKSAFNAYGANQNARMKLIEEYMHKLT